MQLSPPKPDTDWRPPQASDLGGPEQLSDCMIDFRHWHATKGLHSNGGVSDDNLRRLIKLAYFASQTSEEGRFPHFRLFCPCPGGRAAIEELRILKFQSARLLDDVDSIRRLAPSVDSHDRALLVTEENDGNLACDGIVAVMRPTHLGPPQQGTWYRPEGLMVRVDGPGSLLVTEAGLTFVLRAGTVRNVSPYHLIDSVNAWLTELSEVLLARCKLPEEQTSPAGRTALRMLLISLWADVLSSTMDLRHGGAFVVVPDPASAPLLRKTEVVGLDLGAEIEAYWRSRMLAEQRHGDKEQALQACHKQWHRLITRVKAVAQLSAVDGCVVLDRQLRVDSFGAVIHVDATRLAQIKQPDVDYWTNERLHETGNAGTRHAAARNLCSDQPGAFAFVISQDGDLSLFFSDAQRVYRATPLSPADGPDW